MINIILAIFVVGYAAIAFESSIKKNKSATALITGVLCWVAYMYFSPDKVEVDKQLIEHLGDIASVLFFLLGAMTIIELIDAHDGFDVITKIIKVTKKRSLIWLVGFITFFLSAILDNLTTTIVMVSLLRKLVPDSKDRMLFVGIVIIAANAGGAWSPIGDVTTTMLWIEGQISAVSIIEELFLPSLVCLIVPLIFVTYQLKGSVKRIEVETVKIERFYTVLHQRVMLIGGILVLIFVPIFKIYTHLPPFMGMMLGLGVLWIVNELMHGHEDVVDEKQHLTLVSALKNIDISSILFFLGILLAVSALELSGILNLLAEWLNNTIGNLSAIVMSIGIMSSLIDNVPMVAAAQGMYDLVQYPMDHFIWSFLAYTAGTGGSILVIGSAAGVAAMGMEKINFFWYVKHVSWLALLGFFAGAFVYILF